MDNRTCSTPGCDRPARIKSTGECSTCQSRRYRRENPGKGRTVYERRCEACNAHYETSNPRSRYCSLRCCGESRRAKCDLPADHPVRILIAEARKLGRRKPKAPTFAWRTARECPACACSFTPLWTPTAIYCSRKCQRKMSKRRRRARENNTLNTWRWSDFMRIARKFDYRCAYCGIKPGRLDPDHVVPLSRGGVDAISNLLPACPACNADKCAMLLPEWAEWRTRKGKPQVATTWSSHDARFTHLALLSTS